jgi:WD40 repeat protein
VVQIVLDSIITGTSTGLIKFLIATGEGLVALQGILCFRCHHAFVESFLCYCLELSEQRLYSAHSDSLIRSRDLTSLSILETFQGHFDSVLTIAFDESGVMYSSGFDGTIKRWNMVSRRVAFSFELRSSSVTCLSIFNGILAIGMRSGEINLFDVLDATIRSSSKQHRGSVTSLVVFNDDLFSSGADGLLIKAVLQPGEERDVIIDAGPMPINGAVLSQAAIIIMSGDLEIRRYLTEAPGAEFRKIALTTPVSCFTANDNFLVAGTKSGQILAWIQATFEPASIFKGHTSEVNSVLIAEDALYSVSDDKTIIKWSLVDFISLRVLKRYSASALGHLGPVTSLSICDSVLFSGGGDSTVRRWNTQTGTHEEVYFGFSKSVTSVLCYNNSVFAGSEDFSVLMFRPEVKVGQLTSTIAASNTLDINAKGRTRIFKSVKAFSEDGLQRQIFIVGVASGSVVAAILMVVAWSCVYSKRKGPMIAMGATSVIGDNTTITDLKTVVNSVMGISKHAAYLIESSAIAKVKKISAGGGGELFLVKIMDLIFSKKGDEFLVQKVVFVNSKASEDAFYQEVGIMIMLSTFPNFCKIIAYTDKPLSIILKFYPDGSLMDWLAKNHASIEVVMKLMREIAEAIRVMHSYYLAHCDLKTANVLVEVVEKVPCCYLTDFGITQVLSDKIIASKVFNIINLRGLSVYYAAPEAFKSFRTKVYTGIDFKKYDIYSFSCVVYELISKKTPWN